MRDVLRLRNDRLRWLETEGEVIALDEQALVYLGANESGAVLWRCLAEGATREELVSRLAGAFALEPVAAAVDVDRFLAELQRRDLLER